jgi:hypothetical protein
MPVRIFVDRWEREAASRPDEGEPVNAQFVRKALRSNITLCLLNDELRPGTREEIEAVLDTKQIDLGIVWFVDDQTWPETEVGNFLTEHQTELFVVRAGPPDGHGAIIALVRQLFLYVLRGISRQEVGYRERR